MSYCVGITGIEGLARLVFMFLYRGPSCPPLRVRFIVGTLFLWCTYFVIDLQNCSLRAKAQILVHQETIPWENGWSKAKSARYALHVLKIRTCVFLIIVRPFKEFGEKLIWMVGISYLKIIADESTDMHYTPAGRHTHVRVVIRTCGSSYSRAWGWGTTTCSFVEPIVCNILVSVIVYCI